jgi:hypothetical protein
MSIFEHQRFEIISPVQHPYRHVLSEFVYNNPALPSGVDNVEKAMNYIIAVLYPQSKPAVANVAALPLVGNTINDMRVVQDDGDGNAASYRWEQREGEVSPSWHKIYDVDWGTDSILQAWQLKTLDLYVVKYGYDDRDELGNVVVGSLAGQTIYGGASANTNLTLFANAGDGVGPNTGYVQFGDNVRPLADSTFSLGDSSYRFVNVWTDEANISTMQIIGGEISDSSGEVFFNNTDVRTDTKFVVGTLEVSSGAIDDSSGTINFSATNLTTTGTVTGNALVGVASVSSPSTGGGNLLLSSNTLSSTNANGNINLTPNGTGEINAISGFFRLVPATVTYTVSTNTIATYGFGNKSFSGVEAQSTVGAFTWRGYFTNTVGSNSHQYRGMSGVCTVDGAQAYTGEILGIHGAGNYAGSSTCSSLWGARFVAVNSSTGTVALAASLRVSTPANTGGGTITTGYAILADGTSSFGGLVAGAGSIGNISFSSSTISGVDDLIFSPAVGFNNVFTKNINPQIDSTLDFGTSLLRWQSLYLSASISDGSVAIAMTPLMALRNSFWRDVAQTLPAQAGDSLFFDSVTSTWLASPPDTEISHPSLSDLTVGDSGHTQFVMLEGRAGGQVVQGGTAASETLVLESTAHATKGKVLTKDTFQAFTDASYSGGWLGTDVGGSGNRFRHFYSAGEFFGLRLENAASNPASSVQNVGRLLFNTTDNHAYVDTGSAFVRVGENNRYEADTSWDGVVTTQTFTVTTSGMDARKAIWQLSDNTKNFEILYVKMEKLSSTQVRVTTGVPLPAGTYRLIGLE